MKRIQCFSWGKCASGPNVVIGYRLDNPNPLIGEAQYFQGSRGEDLYSRVRPDVVDHLLREHLVDGKIVKNLLWKKESE